MSIKIGDRVPDGTLWEFIAQARQGCTLGPNAFAVGASAAGRKIVVFGLPGAFTPTCSAKHAPGYVDRHAALIAKGADEIWCVAVNDAFVMAAWGRELGAIGKLRMMGDGNGEWTRALGLERDLSGGGMGLRSMRYAMIVDDGIVRALNIEQPGKLEVSDADSMLALL